jgi:crotonobetainyl-CoA:carnitine CoA-transferase CaiB-like acyl-CoA transferase
MSALLERVRVLELTDGLPGAMCGKMMAAAGADVILVEPPETGVGVRWEPPFLDDIRGPDRSGVFLYTAGGKRSLTLDPSTPDGREIFTRLLTHADILIEDRAEKTPMVGAENAPPRFNPRLVRITLRKFSPGGPYENYAAETELEPAALGGWMAQLGEEGRTPLLSNSRTMTAFVPGLMGAITGIAAYLSARQTGRGVNLDLSEHEALLFNTRYNETYFSYTGMEIKRHGKSFAGWSPTYRVFDAADGFVSCAASTDAQVELFLQLAGIGLEPFATREARYDRAEELVARLNDWTKSKTREEIFHQGQQWRVPMGAASTLDEVMGLAQLKHRTYFDEIDHPVAGKRAYPGLPLRFDDSRPRSGRAPLLGEHTAAILCDELGYSRDDVAALMNLRVV